MTTQAARWVTGLSRQSRSEAGLLLETGSVRRRTAQLGSLYVPRDIEGALREQCDTPSMTLVVGEPGVGKTSILWSIAEYLSEHDRAGGTVFLKATDLLPAESARQRADYYDLSRLAEALDDLRSSGSPLVVLLDTVDLLLNAGSVPVVLGTFLEIVSAAGAALIMTCRDKEADLLTDLIREFNIKRLPLRLYSQPELAHAVKTHAEFFYGGRSMDPEVARRSIVNAATRGLPILEVCRRPLTLRMFFETADGTLLDEPLSDAGEKLSVEMDITDLYDKYWRVRVGADRRNNDSSGHAVDATGVAEGLALLMTAFGGPSVAEETARAEVELAGRSGLAELAVGWESTLRELHRRSIVHVTGASPVLEFFHQSFFEYSAARAVVTLGDAATTLLLRRVEELPEDLFLGAVAHQMLVYACRTPSGAHRVDQVFARLLVSDDTSIKQLVVAAVAQARHRGPLTAAAIKAFLGTADEGLVRRYLYYLPTVRHEGLPELLSGLSVIWDREVETLRLETIKVLRRFAALRPEEVLDFVDELDCVGWLVRMPAADFRTRRKTILPLVDSLSRTDPAWAGEQFAAMAKRAIDGTKTQDALAEILTVASSAELTADGLRTLRDLIPDTIQAKESGIVPLHEALAVINYRVWKAEGTDSTTAAAALLSRHETAWSVHVRGQLWGLAELTQREDAETVQATFAVLLGSRLIRMQSDICDAFLRTVLEDRNDHSAYDRDGDRPAFATVFARRQCAVETAKLPQESIDEDGGRNTAVLFRDALDHSALPPREVAEVLRDVGTDEEDLSIWTSAKGLVSLLVPAALGGHECAAEALRRWADRPSPMTLKASKASPGKAPSGDMPKVRRIIAWRLRTLAPDEPAAFPYLIQDAVTEQDATFLTEAIKATALKAGVFPRDHVERVVDVAQDLLSGPPEVRDDGYSLLALMDHGALAPPGIVVEGLGRERDIPTLNAVLDILDGQLDHHPAMWSADADIKAVSSRLRSLSVPSAAPSPGIAERSATLLRKLFCKCAPIEPVSSLKKTLDDVRALTLLPDDPPALHPLGLLMSRVARVDSDAAALLLVEASRHIQAYDGPEQSWKTRRAHRWRPAVADVLGALPRDRWEQVMTELVDADPDLLSQAVDVSIQSRPPSAARFVRELLEGTNAGNRVDAEFRISQLRKQRRTGGPGEWLELLEVWRAGPQAVPPTGDSAAAAGVVPRESIGGAGSADSPDSAQADVVIFTAVELEYLAVRSHLPENLVEREERGAIYEIGLFDGEHGRWNVALVQTGPNNTVAARETERAISVFSPELVMFVGVAGGRKDVVLGDVVAADAIYGYELGKDGAEGYRSRIKTQASSYRLVQRARSVARGNEWRRRLPSSGSDPDSAPRAFVKPIAAGEKVVADSRSRTAKLLDDSCGDALAVEMEGYGFLEGVYGNAGVDALVVRGISDLLSGKNEDDDEVWQPVAAANAAAFAFEVLAKLRR